MERNQPKRLNPVRKLRSSSNLSTVIPNSAKVTSSPNTSSSVPLWDCSLPAISTTLNGSSTERNTGRELLQNIPNINIDERNNDASDVDFISNANSTAGKNFNDEMLQFQTRIMKKEKETRMEFILRLKAWIRSAEFVDSNLGDGDSFTSQQTSNSSLVSFNQISSTTSAWCDTPIFEPCIIRDSNEDWRSFRYSCSYPSCNFEVRHLQKFKNHLGMKHNETSFRCTFCNKGFKNYSSLRRHSRAHQKKKKYICAFLNCNYKTHEGCDLKKHIMTHTGDKPFICEKCGFKSSRKYSLKVHTKRRHGSSNEI